MHQNKKKPFELTTSLKIEQVLNPQKGVSGTHSLNFGCGSQTTVLNFGLSSQTRVHLWVG